MAVSKEELAALQAMGIDTDKAQRVVIFIDTEETTVIVQRAGDDVFPVLQALADATSAGQLKIVYPETVVTELAALPGCWRPSYPGELGPMPIVELDEHGHYRTDPYSACSVCGREVGGAATITVDGQLRQLILPCRHVAQMLPSD